MTTFSETIGRSSSSNNSPASAVREVAKFSHLGKNHVWKLLKVCAWVMNKQPNGKQVSIICNALADSVMEQAE